MTPAMKERIEKARRRLGTRYLLHPANRVKKIPPPIPAFLERRRSA